MAEIFHGGVKIGKKEEDEVASQARNQICK